jgi:hypothetical protein
MRWVVCQFLGKSCDCKEFSFIRAFDRDLRHPYAGSRYVQAIAPWAFSLARRNVLEHSEPLGEQPVVPWSFFFWSHLTDMASRGPRVRRKRREVECRSSGVSPTWTFMSVNCGPRTRRHEGYATHAGLPSTDPGARLGNLHGGTPLVLSHPMHSDLRYMNIW